MTPTDTRPQLVHCGICVRDIDDLRRIRERALAEGATQMLDLTRSDEAIWAETEAACRADPGFMPLDQWQQRFRQAAPAG